ncbi:DUF4303 domain-containing protein [Budvicia aquatica]|nr:DUF4303 domain-containing protein [Budvicia aquatica]
MMESLRSYHEESAANILSFVRQRVDEFTREHQNEVFSGFAFDCNVYEGVELNLCFTTNGHLTDILHYYQTGEYQKYYLSEEGILGLKYNTGDWMYQCFSCMNCIEDHTYSYFRTDEQGKHTYWMELLSQVMVDFLATPEYAAINKSDDFSVLVYDHDEDAEVSEKRLMKISPNPVFILN